MPPDVTAAEVAEDYKLALEDLNSNLRPEISNLTLIARENTEHAHAISEVLMDHIIKVGERLASPLYPPAFAPHVENSLVHETPKLTSDVGAATKETASIICAGLDHQECRHAVHTVLREETLPSLHGGLCVRRPLRPPEDGRDAQDVERGSARVLGQPASVPARDGAAYRECPHQG